MNKAAKKKKMTRGQFVLLAMTVPSIIFIFLFSYLPIMGWGYAFFDYRIGYKLKDCVFTGLETFKYALLNPTLIDVLINTFAIGLLSLLSIPIACLVAIFLSEMAAVKYRKFVQTVITLPNFISWVIIYAICFAFFSADGLLNQILMNAGLADSAVNILGNQKIGWFLQAGLSIWKTFGYTSIIFFASIAGIDQQLYDAARVDGAGRFAEIRYITLPSLMPTAIVLLLINVGFILSNGFEQFYVFMNPAVQPTIEVLDYYVYRIGMLQNDIPASVAVSMVKSLVSVLMVFGVNSLAKKTTGNSIV